MIIYLLSHGDYSEYSILGAFSSHEKAAEVRDTMPEQDSSYRIEEFEVDQLTPIPPGHKMYCVSMNRNGNLAQEVRNASKYAIYERLHLIPQPYKIFPPSPNYKDGFGQFYVIARAEEHAVKIAGELRIKAIYEERWPSNKK